MVICTSGNVVITGDDGNMVKFKHKCPYCGYVDDHIEDLCSIVSGSVKVHSSYRCFKCGQDMGCYEFRRT